ncbi:MAG: MFS transporter [Candidatus Hodarchaeales archaeon]|jgi:BCD family chlorophyll transporter-like MFS transporter
MVQPYSSSDSRNFIEKNTLSLISVIFVSIAHLSVGIGIIGLSTFIPFELTSSFDWSETIIALLLGIATLFELSRIFIGYLQDRISLLGSYRRNYVILGLSIQTIGLLVISQLIGSILIIIGMILFTIGSATVSTTIDAYLVDNSNEQNRNKYAATLQFFRLGGFAVGGILGAILYANLGFKDFFILLAVSGFLIGLVSVLTVRESKNYKSLRQKQLSKQSWMADIHLLKTQIRNPAILGMIFFLLLYPLGLFMQDAILEPYAVRIFNFDSSGVGRLAAVWGISTLIFIPLGILFDKKIGRMRTIIFGTFIAAIGLLIIAWLGLNPFSLRTLDLVMYQNSLLIFLFIFGMGLGLMTTPSTALMLDVTAVSQNKTKRLFYLYLD